MPEKLDVEVQSLNKSMDLGSLAAMQPVTLSRDRVGRVTVTALDESTIGHLDETTLNEIDDISEWMAEIRTIRREMNGQPAKIAIRIRKKPLNDCIDPRINVAPVRAEDDDDDSDLLTREQLLFVANECKETFRDEALREWVNRVVEAPLEARAVLVEQMLSHPTCGPLVELLMKNIEHCST